MATYFEVIILKKWEDKAKENINKWGVQTLKVMTLAMMKELGELTQAILQFKYSDPFENEIEESVEDRELKYNHIINELDDLAALMYQMKWVLEPHRKMQQIITSYVKNNVWGPDDEYLTVTFQVDSSTFKHGDLVEITVDKL